MTPRSSLSTACSQPPAAARHYRPACWAQEAAPLNLDPAAVFAAGVLNHHIANTAYPIAHARTFMRHRQRPEQYSELLGSSLHSAACMSLYAHIPFCEHRCAYCEYTVLDRHDPHIERIYHQALLQELQIAAQHLNLRGLSLAGFDIGGGTPSLIDPARIGQLLSQVHGLFRLRPGYAVSIETTPEIAARHPERLASYRSYGIDRISMGLQMLNAHLRAAYARQGDTSLHQRAVEAVRAAGFRRFNIDLMYGFAQQSASDFAATIEHTLALAPDVITLYRMRYKGTRVAAEASAVGLACVSDMAELAHGMLGAAGYHANPGKNTFSRDPSEAGTSAYLTERVVWSTPYLGLGLGAQSFTNHVLAYNHGAASKRADRYLAAVDAGQLPIQDLYHLPPSEGMAKMIAVSFYFGEINLAAFAMRFGVALQRHFAREVAFVLDQGLMHYHGQNLRLTTRGARMLPGVVSLFYSDSVKAHLLTL
jgi:oxygen-independent coproporphyrinogen III oxidase